MKLLIVDDESRIRTLIAKYAAFEGYAWEEAADGMEAIEKARDGSIGLVILDIMMPELDGFSAAREMRKFRPNLPIILLSARGEEYDKIHGFRAGHRRLCGQALFAQRADDAGGGGAAAFGQGGAAGERP